jgi:hypothetical protein
MIPGYELYSLKEGMVYNLGNALLKQSNGVMILTDINGEPLNVRKR